MKNALVPNLPYAINDDIVIARKGSQFLERLQSISADKIEEEVRNGVASDVRSSNGTWTLHEARNDCGIREAI